MELYKDKVNYVRLVTEPGYIPISASASLNDGPEVALTIENQSGVNRVRLPYLDNEGDVILKYKFSADTFSGRKDVVTTKKFNIVTPILSEEDIKEIHPRATPAEIVSIERATRLIINAHCGQEFGHYVGVIPVRGSGTSILTLPRQLNVLNGISGIESRLFALDPLGFAIKFVGPGIPPVKADNNGLHRHVGGVIHNPNNVKANQFPTSTTYDVDGEWGWRAVPEAVREAARLLVNDYACGDNTYRDRYLTSMTAADWRIQFNSAAFLKTGNVRADQLLSNFVLKSGWVAI